MYILENIGRLSLYERPIHCTDIKRETLYIKHDDIWEKDETKQNIKKAITTVKNDIKSIDIRIGVVSNTLLQLKLKENFNTKEH